MAFHRRCVQATTARESAPFEDFIIVDDDMRQRVNHSMGFALTTDLRPQPRDAVGQYLRYKLEHMELFDAKELPWPCPREVCQAINEYTMDFRGLTLRQLEAVAFLHQAFPPASGLPRGQTHRHQYGEVSLIRLREHCTKPRLSPAVKKIGVEQSHIVRIV